MSARPRSIAAALTAVAIAVTLSGCSSANKDACQKLEKSVTDLSKKLPEVTKDPSTLEKTYTDAAGQIRSIAGDASGDVKTQANKVADELETLGKKVGQALADPTSADASSIDPTKLENAGNALEDACK